MKTLTESLFSGDLITKDLFSDPEFKKWINRPDVLWYLFYYWADGMEDAFEDFMGDQWSTYKPMVDTLLDLINKKVDSYHMWFAYSCNYDSYDFYYKYEDTEFVDEADYQELFESAMYEIKHHETEIFDCIYKSWFKGSFPKGSAVTELLVKACGRKNKGKIVYPGRIDGGIFLTNDDTIIVFILPKGIDKSILKLFNIK